MYVWSVDLYISYSTSKLATIFKGDTTQPKIQFIMALMIFSAKSQVDPLPCLECTPACVA